MKKVILHIGQSKTGTTSLQACLQKNRARLAEQGILYPDVFRNGVALDLRDHNGFADAIAGFIRYPWMQAQDYMDQFRKQAEDHNCHTMILSAESFWGTPQVWRLSENQDFYEEHKRKMNILRNLLGACDVHIYLYLRRQDLWLESIIAHTVRYQGLQKRKSYESDGQIASFLSPHLGYSDLVALWRDTFRPASMVAIPYEKDSLHTEGTATDFLYRTGLVNLLGDEVSLEISRENKSWDRRYVEIKKALNKMSGSKVRERVLIETINELNNGEEHFSPYRIEDSLRARLLDRYKKENAGLAQEFSTASPDFFTVLSEGNEKGSKATPEEVFPVLLRFEEAWFSNKRRVRYVVRFIKDFLRYNFPAVHSLAKGAVRSMKSLS